MSTATRSTAQVLRASGDESLARIGRALSDLDSRLNQVAQDSGGGASSDSSGAGSAADAAISAPSNITISASGGENGRVNLAISADLPMDSKLAGLVFIVERPASADMAPTGPTLPGVFDPDLFEVYCPGDGSSLSLTLSLDKPLREETWIVYALPFADGYRNPFVRLTSLTPVAPADHTAYGTVLINSAIVSSDALGDVAITGTPALTPTGYGTLTIDLQYIPPYVSGPALSIGDFQGVTPFVEYEDGSVKALPDQPYLANPAATPPDNLGTVSIQIPMPAPQTIYVQLCSYSTTARLPYKPHATAPSSRWVAIVISSGTVGGGMATQVSAFAVMVLSETLAGVASGGKQGTFKVTYSKPVDDKWKSVLIERIACDASYTPLAGASWGRLGETTASPELYGPWPWPTTTEYWRFRARSVNQEDKPNDTAYPQVLLALTADGTFTLANDSIAAAMLQDLAVTARAMADSVIADARMFAPQVIPTAAIGLGAITYAQIQDATITGAKIALATIESANIKELEVTQITGSGTVSFTGAVNFDVPGGAYMSLGAYFAVGGDASILGALSLPYTPLAISEGGTAARTAADARTNLDVYSKAEVDALAGGAVASVFGRTGAVVALSTDYAAHYAPLEYYPGQTVNDELYALNTGKADAFTGATGTVANPTSITVANGIVTAIS